MSISDGALTQMSVQVSAAAAKRQELRFNVEQCSVQPGPKNKEAAEAARTNLVRFELKEPLRITGAYLVLKFMDFNAQALPSFVVDLNGCKRVITLIEHRAKGSLTNTEQSLPFRQIILFPEGTLTGGKHPQNYKPNRQLGFI